VSGRFQQNTSERPEKVEIERDRPLNVGDGKIDVMYAFRGDRSPGLTATISC
jgi:hypothetical protein